MAERACHAAASTTRFGLTQALDRFQPSGGSMGIATEKLRFTGALLVILAGLVVISFLAYALPVGEGRWQPSDVIALVGALTTFLGTVIGAFLGVQVGAANKEKAEGLATRALAALPPEAADKVLRQENQSAAE